MGFCLTCVSAQQPLVVLTFLPSLLGMSGHFPQGLAQRDGPASCSMDRLEYASGIKGNCFSCFRVLPGDIPKRMGQLFC